MIEKPENFVVEINRSAGQLNFSQLVVLKHIDFANFCQQNLFICFHIVENIR